MASLADVGAYSAPRAAAPRRRPARRGCGAPVKTRPARQRPLDRGRRFAVRGGPAGQRWSWTDVAGAATRLRRRPCEMRLRLPTIAGAVPLRLAHRLFWDYQARVVAAEDVSGVAAQNVALLRERGASSLTLLAEKIRCAQGVVSLVVDDRKHSCGNRLFFATKFSATTRLGLWSFPHRWRLGPED